MCRMLKRLRVQSVRERCTSTEKASTYDPPEKHKTEALFIKALEQNAKMQHGLIYIIIINMQSKAHQQNPSSEDP